MWRVWGAHGDRAELELYSMQVILAFLQPTAAVVSFKKRRLHFYLRAESTLCGHTTIGNSRTDIKYSIHCLHQKNILGCIKGRSREMILCPILNFGEVPPGLLHLESPALEQHRPVGAIPEEGHQDNPGCGGAPLLQRQGEGLGAVQSGEGSRDT